MPITRSKEIKNFISHPIENQRACQAIFLSEMTLTCRAHIKLNTLRAEQLSSSLVKISFHDILYRS